MTKVVRALQNAFDNLFKLDLWILIPYLIMCVFGVIMVYSASSNLGNPASFCRKQFCYVLLGIIIIYAIRHIKIRAFQNQYVIGVIYALFLMILISLKFIGKSINGAAGWISLGPINIQPSEMTKLFFVIYLAHLISNRQSILNYNFDEWSTKKRWIKSMIGPLGLSAFLILWILVQPDLGGAIIDVVIIGMMIMFGGVARARNSVIAFVSGIVLSTLLLLFVLVPYSIHHFSNYQLQRIVGFAQPFAHVQGIGKQLVNSYYSLSNGGIFGVGLGNGIEKTGYLPEPNTDFIMAVVAEEMGLITVIIILILLAIIVSRIVLVGIRDDDVYYSLICYGCATYIMVEMLFNMGGVTGLLPITGVTFPFISYGGSSMFTLSAGIGLVLKISQTQTKRRFNVQLERKS